MIVFVVRSTTYATNKNISSMLVSMSIGLDIVVELYILQLKLICIPIICCDLHSLLPLLFHFFLVLSKYFIFIKIIYLTSIKVADCYCRLLAHHPIATCYTPGFSDIADLTVDSVCLSIRYDELYRCN